MRLAGPVLAAFVLLGPAVGRIPAQVTAVTAAAAPIAWPGGVETGLQFPVGGVTSFSDSFGDPRGRHLHGGTDLIAAKGTPVLAAADGTVDWIQDGARGRCCAVGLRHADGSRSLYMHLDNDSPGTDDGLRVGIAPGLRIGMALRRGMLLGWVGDSGNAESTSPHLHFELVGSDGRSRNSFAALAALRPAEVQRPRAAAVTTRERRTKVAGRAERRTKVAGRASARRQRR